MKRSTVFDLKQIIPFQAVVKNKILLVLFFSFTIGLVFGVFSFSGSETAVKWADSYFENFLDSRINASFWGVLSDSFLSSAVFLLAVFLSGTSLLGVVLSPLLVCVRGFLYGIFSALLYSSYDVKGIAFQAVIVVPSAILFVLTLLSAAKHSINFSAVIAKLTLSHTIPVSLYEPFKRYCTSYLLILLLVLTSALADAVMCVAFLSFFNF